MDPVDPAEEQDQERVEKMFRDLESRARKVGLYVEQAVITALPGHEDEEDPDQVMVMASYTIGDRAFLPVVQDPETHGFNEAFREMRLDAEEEEAHRIQQEGIEWLSRREEEEEE